MKLWELLNGVKGHILGVVSNSCCPAPVHEGLGARWAGRVSYSKLWWCSLSQGPAQPLLDQKPKIQPLLGSQTEANWVPWPGGRHARPGPCEGPG